jgi:hypothetical protein
MADVLFIGGFGIAIILISFSLLKMASREGEDNDD